MVAIDGDTEEADESLFQMYVEVCDVVERARQQQPVERQPQQMHSSDYARAAANRILEIMKPYTGDLEQRLDDAADRHEQRIVNGEHA